MVIGSKVSTNKDSNVIKEFDRIYLLQADVYYAEGFLSKSMQVLINAVIHCEQHNLINHYISTKLQIAQCQVLN